MKVQKIGNKNLTEITKTNGDIVLVSYETPVAARIGEKYYRTSEKFSKTTSGHINYWLGTINAEEKPQSFLDALI